MKKLKVLILIFLYSITTYGQDYNTIKFKSSGKIEIPSDWKVYDKDWNDNITKKAGFDPSKKITIVRASDYDNSTFYLKLSTKQLDEMIPKNEILSQDFLDLLNDDLNSIISAINRDPKSRYIESSKATLTTIGDASGGYTSYTQINQAGEKRKTILYTLINGKTFYNLTVSWAVTKNENSENILSEIIRRLKLSE